MAHMNFNTDTKFWSTLCVQSFSTIPAAPNKGCIAFYDTSNSGMMSVATATSGVFEWKPIVHTVDVGEQSDDGGVTQDGGHVTISFPKPGGGGNCSKKTLVSHISASAQNPISTVIVELPNDFDNEKSFLMTTVYTMNDKGAIQSTVQPDVTVVKTEDDNYGVQFSFDTPVTEKLKIMILFDQVADDYDPEVYTNGNHAWEEYNQAQDVSARTPGDKNKNVNG